MAITPTRKKYLEVWTAGGRYVSRHRDLTECYQSASEDGDQWPVSVDRDNDRNYEIKVGSEVFYTVGLIAGTDIVGVTPPNSQPVWVRTPVVSFTEGIGGTQNLLNDVTDPDGDTLTISWDPSSTPLPSGYSVSAPGILTATAGVVFGNTPGVRFLADDGVTTPVATQNVTIVTNAAGGQGGKRWNPGHYVKINKDPIDPDQATYWANAISVCGDEAQDTNILGAMVAIAWGRCNPTGNVFNWSDIYDCITALNGQQLIVMITYKNFGAVSPGLHAPADLVGQIITSNSGNVAAVWRDGTGGFPDVSQRYANCLLDFVREFDANPRVEMLSQTESSPSLGGTAQPADYSATALGVALRDHYTQVAAAIDKLNFCPMINSLIEGQIPLLLEKCYDLGVGVGHPDARGTPGYLGFEGDGSDRDYRTILPCLDIGSNSTLNPPANYTPSQLIDFEQVHKTTHLAWIAYAQQAGRTWADILAAIAGDPLLHTACPTIYASCDTGVPPPGTQGITGITFNMNSVINTAPGNSAVASETDNWPITWAWDDHQYTAFGDGWGFENLAGNESTRASIGVSRIEGAKGAYSAFDVWKSGKLMGGLNGKCQSMLGANNKLYMSWDYALGSGNDGTGSQNDAYEASTIWVSNNAGVSWAELIRWDHTDWGGTLNNDGFFAPAFLQFNQNYADARDAYVYMYLMEHDDDNYQVQTPGGISLVRCLLANIESGLKADWTYLSALSAGNVPTWSSNLAARIMIFQDATDGNHVTQVSYNKPLNRYMMTTLQGKRRLVDGTMIFGMYDAPEPWGPWHTVVKQDAQAIGPNLSTGASCILWGFSNKWLSVDGLNAVMVGTLQGNDEWGTVNVTLTVGTIP